MLPYAYVYVYVYVYVCVHIYIYIYICMQLLQLMQLIVMAKVMYAYMYTYMHIYIYIYAHVNVFRHTTTCMQLFRGQITKHNMIAAVKTWYICTDGATRSETCAPATVTLAHCISVPRMQMNKTKQNKDICTNMHIHIFAETHLHHRKRYQSCFRLLHHTLSPNPKPSLSGLSLARAFCRKRS